MNKSIGQNCLNKKTHLSIYFLPLPPPQEGSEQLKLIFKMNKDEDILLTDMDQI